MRKFFAFILSVLLTFTCFSFTSFTAFADFNSEVEAWLSSDSEVRTLAKNTFIESSDDEVILLCVLSLLDSYNRGLITDTQAKTVLNALNDKSMNAPVQTEFYFGQGTYIVGIDLQAGTYDIVCESTANDSYTDTMSDLGSLYSNAGVDDYFSALGGLLESLDKMSVKLINSKGFTDRYLDLKAGESARIILEEGMRIDITDGSAKLTFIR